MQGRETAGRQEGNQKWGGTGGGRGWQGADRNGWKLAGLGACNRPRKHANACLDDALQSLNSPSTCGGVGGVGVGGVGVGGGGWRRRLDGFLADVGPPHRRLGTRAAGAAAAAAPHLLGGGGEPAAPKLCMCCLVVEPELTRVSSGGTLCIGLRGLVLVDVCQLFVGPCREGTPLIRRARTSTATPWTASGPVVSAGAPSAHAEVHIAIHFPVSKKSSARPTYA